MLLLKRLFHASLFFILTHGVMAQVQLPTLPDSLFSTYFHQRHSLFKTLPYTKGDIIFLGNSITDGGEWGELFTDTKIKNRGISGDISAGIIYRLPEITTRKPKKVFIMIGTNDLARGITKDSLCKNYTTIIQYIQQQSPSTQVYMHSILPVNDTFGKFTGHTKNNGIIKEVNLWMQHSATPLGFTYVDLHTPFCNKMGKLNTQFSNDGLHLTGEGYRLWKHMVFPHVYDMQPSASLIPSPQSFTYNPGMFPLFKVKHIYIAHDSLKQVASHLQHFLEQQGIMANISKTLLPGENTIALKIAKVDVPINKTEAYRLIVTAQEISLSANTQAGLFHGIQSIKQLARDGSYIDCVTITDWPSFQWRGFMTDAGRNFQSVTFLKKIIDVMALYKLNIFHHHLTEDIAWRLEIKSYPALTSPDNMLRNKGMYYTVEDIKELIAYCNLRHILYIPEIDMPGHSAAFKRTMGFDMQSDSGLVVMKKIIEEVINTYPITHMHIGGDEVKISNPQFLPKMVQYIQSRGIKTISWQPGGNVDKNSIQQLWMRDGAVDSSLTYIDSRHLYLNHMDPLEAVTTLFYRQIGDRSQQTKNVLGATLCLWHDRNISSEQDLLTMNPVYPGIITFAERTWLGNGEPGWVANIKNDGHTSLDFAAFENKLLDHKKSFFKNEPFPYQQQSTTQWNFYGPYDNGGNVTYTSPLEKLAATQWPAPVFSNKGGTIVMRHWWNGLIPGIIPQPKENSTWYATTKLNSNEEGYKPFWIGFYDISRSNSSHSPISGTWYKPGNAVWVNGQLINPPQWHYADKQGHLENPLLDEGYSYRQPTQIWLKKGINFIVVKSVITSFAATNWNNPPKWSFTCVPVNED